MPEITAHPSRDQLRAYNLGQLPPDEAVVVESHISECEPCCDTIISLTSDDTFVGLLKEARQLPTDQAVDHAVATASSSGQDVPVQLAEHPRYEVLGLIGKGGMGDVYKARHRKMERTVALKVVNRGLVQKTEAVDRFHREVKAAAQLSHPNIVTAFDADQAGDFHFMVMEYVDGVDLSQTVKDRGALPVAEACDYIRQAAIGMQHAHQRGMVHRDIKPHNLMVTSDGTVKILDFGLASLAPEAIADADTVEARGDLTAAGAIMGTPDFISPEQADDARRADIRSDIYSLGATLYFLLSAQPPFAEGSVMHKLKSHAHVQPDSLDTLRDDVPKELVAIVSRMMAKDPNERYLTPSEVADALESFLRTWRSGEVESPQQEPSSGGSRSGLEGEKSSAGDAGRDWPLLVARILFAIALLPVALICYELWAWNDATAVEAAHRTWAYMLVTLCLSSIAGIAFFLHRLNSDLSQSNRGDRRIFRMTASEALTIAAVLVAGIFAAVIYYVQTDHGVVRVEVTDPSFEVSIKDHTITMKDGDGKPLAIRPGEATLIVRKEDDDFEFETESFQIRRGDEIVFKVEMLNGEIVVRKDEKPFDQSHLLVGEWVWTESAPGSDKLRLTLKPNGTFELIDPVVPERVRMRATGTYTADFSVSPAHLDLDATILQPARDRELEPAPGHDEPAEAAPAMEGPERERIEKHKFKTIIELVDANTLRMAGLEEESRPKTFGKRPLVWHRQGDTKVDPALHRKPARAARTSEKAVTDNERILGSWQATDVLANGKGTPREELKAIQARYTFARNKLLMSYNGKKVEKTYRLEHSGNPKQIDTIDEDGNVVFGIYEFRGDTLRICWAVRPRIERPTSFESKPDSKVNLLTLKRESDEEADTQWRADTEVSAERKTTEFLIEAAHRGDLEAVKAALKAGVAPNRPSDPLTNLFTPKQLTALHWAAARRLVDGKTVDPSPEIAKLLIEAGADVNAKDNLDQTPLEWAAKYESPDIVEMLIKAGADVNAESRYGTVLQATKNVEVAKLLIEAGADVNAGTTLTPLAEAAKDNNLAMVQLLIEKGAKVNDPKNPPLQLAGKPEVAKALLEAGADVNLRNAKGETVLHLPNMYFPPDPETVKLLIEAGADVNAKTATGATPVHAAIQQRKLEIAKLLIAAGADVDAKDKQGDTPLAVAHANLSWARRTPSADNKPYEAAVQLLVDAGAKDDGRTKLQHAVAAGDLEQVKKLIAAKADVNETGPRQITAAHLASEQGRAEILAALIEAGAKVDAVDAQRMRPLHLAANAETARLLIAKGAKVNAGMLSPLYFATMNGKADVVRELLKNDANARDSDCTTMLNWATFAGQLEVVKALFELRDAKTLLAVKSTYSPLHVAAGGSFGDMSSPASAQQRLNIAKLLVENGADVNAPWGSNVHPRSGAARMVGTTPLMFASQRGEAEMVKFLLDQKADVQAKNASSQTALHFAGQYGHRDVVELLLKAKADVNALTREAKTPLDLTEDAAVKVLLIQNGGKTASEVLQESQP